MHKKQLYSVIQGCVDSVVATMNQDIEDNAPLFTEEEARTLFSMHFKRSAKGLVAAACGCEVADVKWVEPKPPKKKAKPKKGEEVVVEAEDDEGDDD